MDTERGSRVIGSYLTASFTELNGSIYFSMDMCCRFGGEGWYAWTNGGTEHGRWKHQDVTPMPRAWRFCHGVGCEYGVPIVYNGYLLSRIVPWLCSNPGVRCGRVSVVRTCFRVGACQVSSGEEVDLSIFDQDILELID